MAERDQIRRGASLPIPPTAVVATIDMSRPLRAEAITTAVLRKSTEPIPTVPRVMAYAAPMTCLPRPAVHAARARRPAPACRMPQLQPAPHRRRANARRRHPRIDAVAPPHGRARPDHDRARHRGLRMWIGPQSTRQKSYALLTMPDFAADART